LSVYGELVGRHGLAESHRLLLAAVPDGARVLDVGCDEGYLAAALTRRGCAVVGVEPDPRAAELARGVCEDVLTGDVEDAALRAAVERRGASAAGQGLRPFDVVLFGDVLEHLADPLTVLRWAAEIGDRIVVSLPNIAHWTARRQVLRGRFPQEDFGLFDRTHLRFFTRASARGLVESAGLTILDEAFAGAPLPLQSRLPTLARLQAPALRLSPELFALQIVLTCGSPAAR
jgi:methionine biosynthesis protein MetW